MNTINLYLHKKAINLQEFDSCIVDDLTDTEFQILSTSFKKYLNVQKLDNKSYKITSKEYIGNITLPEHIIFIAPKFNNINFTFMLSIVYDYNPFTNKEILYSKEKDESIYEHIIKNLLDRIELLCKKGIYKNYYDIEENLPFVKGRILLRDNFIHNNILNNKLFCRYSEFGPDIEVNRIIKFTLHILSKLTFNNKSLPKKIKILLHYFESVSLINYRKIPSIYINRLNKNYSNIINICKMVLAHTSLQLGKEGESIFSSFLIDMNYLFEIFLLKLLESKLKQEGFTIKYQYHNFADLENKTAIRPDIVIIKNGKQLLILDAKYKKKTIENEENDDNEELILQTSYKIKNISHNDINQMWIYCIALDVPIGILVYPKHLSITEDTRTLKQTNNQIIIKSIDLNQDNYGLFMEECNRFVNDIIDMMDINIHKNNI